ncbi:MAG: hypothetical protein WC455_14230 [Dehalococcoidia bacterium]
MSKHNPKDNPAKLPIWKRTAATLKARRQRCKDCGGVLPEYLCATCGGVGCIDCQYVTVKPCRCGK